MSPYVFILLTLLLFFFLMIPPPPSSTLFPYTTLFRSRAVFGAKAQALQAGDRSIAAVVHDHPHHRNLFLDGGEQDRKSTRLNSSHVSISYAVFCLKKKMIHIKIVVMRRGISMGRSLL